MKKWTLISANAAAVIATANCTASLKNGPRPLRSSHRPSAKRTEALEVVAQAKCEKCGHGQQHDTKLDEITPLEEVGGDNAGLLNEPAETPGHKEQLHSGQTGDDEYHYRGEDRDPAPKRDNGSVVSVGHGAGYEAGPGGALLHNGRQDSVLLLAQTSRGKTASREDWRFGRNHSVYYRFARRFDFICSSSLDLALLKNSW